MGRRLFTPLKRSKRFAKAASASINRRKEPANMSLSKYCRCSRFEHSCSNQNFFRCLTRWSDWGRLPTRQLEVIGTVLLLSDRPIIGSNEDKTFPARARWPCLVTDRRWALFEADGIAGLPIWLWSSPDNLQAHCAQLGFCPGRAGLRPALTLLSSNWLQ